MTAVMEATAPAAETKVSPAAARTAAEAGINPADVQGTGRGGVVSKADVIAAAEVKMNTEGEMVKAIRAGEEGNGGERGRSGGLLRCRRGGGCAHGVVSSELVSRFGEHLRQLIYPLPQTNLLFSRRNKFCSKIHG